MTHPATQRRILIDNLAVLLRKPTAAPVLTAGEVIALALNGMGWVPGRPVEDGDQVITQVLRLLGEAGYAVVVATKEHNGAKGL